MDSALFVANENVLQTVRLMKFIININYRPSWVTEYRVDALFFEEPDKNLRTFELQGKHLLLY
jgi:hypothetical protein